MSDIERYDERREAQRMSQQNIAALQMIVSEIAQQSGRLAEIEDRLSNVESFEAVAAETRQWMSLIGFINTFDVQVDTDEDTIKMLGQKVTAWHKQTGRYLKHKKAHHEKWGRVNSYNVHNLADFFNDGGYRWNRVAFGEEYL